jgi:hypothetical protein
VESNDDDDDNNNNNVKINHATRGVCSRLESLQTLNSPPPPHGNRSKEIMKNASGFDNTHKQLEEGAMDAMDIGEIKIQSRKDINEDTNIRIPTSTDIRISDGTDIRMTDDTGIQIPMGANLVMEVGQGPVPDSKGDKGRLDTIHYEEGRLEIGDDKSNSIWNNDSLINRGPVIVDDTQDKQRSEHGSGNEYWTVREMELFFRAKKR